MSKDHLDLSFPCINCKKRWKVFCYCILYTWTHRWCLVHHVILPVICESNLHNLTRCLVLKHFMNVPGKSVFTEYWSQWGARLEKATTGLGDSMLEKVPSLLSRLFIHKPQSTIFDHFDKSLFLQFSENEVILGAPFYYILKDIWTKIK